MIYTCAKAPPPPLAVKGKNTIVKYHSQRLIQENVKTKKGKK